MMNRDKLVAIRNGMVIVLQEAIKLGNKGEYTLYNDTIMKIRGMEGYKVERLQGVMEIEGTAYTSGDVVVIVYENNEPIMTIYRNKHDEMIVLEVDIDDLLTQAELDMKYSDAWTFEAMMDMLTGRAVEPI
ncbi:hypothetical protein Kirov_260 [Bacillus phage Kirov]|uniref:Uncharacterized protein n=1 Tax=Bacillus phage Kirov TaxID=2783539 RepID=A0A7S6RBG3_9CAUD|nr:hypothetical protein PQE67_gp044 [Bacillus phage Kirov]QOV08459.1 hypothetical protein Kirov_260 [Bacillus phage Kirov]